MKILFISDLHLCESQPHLTELFLHFLQHLAPQAQRLYILGDLFEYWIGDDDDSALHRQIAQALSHTAQQVPIYFMHGNRDFLVGKRYAQQAGFSLLPDPCLQQLEQQPVLLMHGDSLCTDDRVHQRNRLWMRNRFCQWLFLNFFSLPKRKQIAENTRLRSQRHIQRSAKNILDVHPQAVVDNMRKYQVKTLIHGHTHRPAIHPVAEISPQAQRIVLSDWREQGNYLLYANGEFSLKYFDTDCIQI
jgi:UDP-2,3-diacylglucosamine hydrolase